MKRSLVIKIGELEFKNPVMVASGTFGDEYGELTDISKLGAIVTKTITLNPRAGNPPPRVFETPCGMLNSIGLENAGLEHFLAKKLPMLVRKKVPVIVSIAGESEEEFAKVAKGLAGAKGVVALELNLSCPNIRHGARAHLIAQDGADTASIVSVVKNATKLPVIAKLSPNVTDISKIAIAAQGAGADALSLINTVVGVAVDIKTRRPIFNRVTAGLSGPAIKPIALKAVWETYKKIDIPIIGIGGIMDYKDALEFILCGASAVQVGTANFIDPDTVVNVIKGLSDYMEEFKINNITDLIGALKTNG